LRETKQLKIDIIKIIILYKQRMQCYQSYVCYRISEVFKSNNSSLSQFVIIHLNNKHRKYEQLDQTGMNYLTQYHTQALKG